MKLLTRGDFDGLFALGLNNLIDLLLLTALCHGVLGFSNDIIYGRILPGMAVGVILGNAFYAWQAIRLGKKENRTDVCALPFGVNLLPIFVYVFYVMAPAQSVALASGLGKEAAQTVAWQAGLVAGMGSGLIELFGAFVVGRLLKITPRAALLSALAGIGLMFIGAGYLFRAYTYPLIGFTTLALTLCIYYGGLRLPGRLPGGLLVLILGTAISWLLYQLGQPSPVKGFVFNAGALGFHFPWPRLADNLAALHLGLTYLPMILPMGFINLVGSMQCLESAAAAGDRYDPKSSLAVNGIGTLAAALCGSPFPTTLYIGHPGWKSIGARAGYSTLNAIAIALLCFTGALSLVGAIVPIEAGMTILIWIGITMGAQAFQATDRKHAPAVVLGLMPALGAFSAMIIKQSLTGAGFGGNALGPFTPELFQQIEAKQGLFLDGVFALEQGYLYTSMILSAALACLIDRKFKTAAGWLVAGAALSLTGFANSYVIQPGDVTGSLQPGWKWVTGYLVMAAVVFAASFGRKEEPGGETFG